LTGSVLIAMLGSQLLPHSEGSAMRLRAKGLAQIACGLLLLTVCLVAVKRDSHVPVDERGGIPGSLSRRLKEALDVTNLTVWATQVADGQPAGTHNVFSFPPIPLLPGASDPRASFVTVDKDAEPGMAMVKVEFGGGFGAEGIVILLGGRQPPATTGRHTRIELWTSNVYLYCSP
jgi:hypothetical protein